MSPFALQRSRLAALALGGLLVASTAATASDDATLRVRIESRLVKAGLTTQGEIQVSVRDGRAELNGAVPTFDVLERAGKAARKETAQVENRLRVLPEPRSDAEIRKDVESAILRYPYYTVFDSIGLQVTDGVVVLEGSVRHPYRRNDIHERVARVAGIRGLHDRVGVQGVSFHDDRLRAQLLSGIYGGGLLSHYGTLHPPVRILVDRGRVTLTGYVSSEVERALIGSIARGTLAFGVENRIQLESERGQEAERKRTDS
jgi:osmotically-inducible protein OsmY